MAVSSVSDNSDLRVAGADRRTEPLANDMEKRHGNMWLKLPACSQKESQAGSLRHGRCNNHIQVTPDELPGPDPQPESRRSRRRASRRFDHTIIATLVLVNPDICKTRLFEQLLHQTTLQRVNFQRHPASGFQQTY